MAARPPGLIRPEDVNLITGQPTIPDHTPFDSSEIRRFDRDLVKMAGYYHTTRDLFSLVLEDRDFYLFAGQVAKAQLNTKFGGAIAGAGEVGFQFIRPMTIHGTRSWFKNYATAGWNDVFGSAAAPVDLSTTSAAFGNPQNRVLVAFPKLGNLIVPKVQEVRFNIAPTDYPVWPVRFASLTDTYLANLPYAVLIQKNAKFYMRGYIDTTNVIDATYPLGLTYALGPYLLQE